ncbi:helix-turn-helix transcriptional regulator [Pseudomonas sp.]|uniref:helix-turn-helix domain-containing protein n=1 Tax=Pseudomonas sp. TaxID=306 RepID=UPI0028A83108|nr:helix-turn-helix transcriptional regulator [Pseudomonas sp.]
MSEFLSANLHLLCKHYRSIAEVCRQLGINRAQFNKYLGGKSQPTPYNLKRICDFFGVEEDEISLPPVQFAALISSSRRGADTLVGSMTLPPWLAHLQAQNSPNLTPYLGYYHEYYHSLSTPGYVLCGLVWLYEQSGTYRYVRFERLRKADTPRPYVHFRYQGLALSLQNRLFLCDYESLTENEISQTVLIPSSQSRISRLNGLKLGVSASDAREPACARVVWEFLGKDIHRGAAYRRCGLYLPNDPALDEDLRQRLDQVQLTQNLFRIG